MVSEIDELIKHAISNFAGQRDSLSEIQDFAIFVCHEPLATLLG